MYRPMRQSVVILSFGLQGLDAFEQVSGVQHRALNQVVALLGALKFESAHQRLGPRLQQRHDAGSFHDLAVPRVHRKTSAGGHHLPVIRRYSR